VALDDLDVARRLGGEELGGDGVGGVEVEEGAEALVAQADVLGPSPCSSAALAS
jgi:hypothetical protein